MKSDAKVFHPSIVTSLSDHKYKFKIPSDRIDERRSLGSFDSTKRELKNFDQGGVDIQAFSQMPKKPVIFASGGGASRFRSTHFANIETAGQEWTKPSRAELRTQQRSIDKAAKKATRAGGQHLTIETEVSEPASLSRKEKRALERKHKGVEEQGKEDAGEKRLRSYYNTGDEVPRFLTPPSLELDSSEEKSRSKKRAELRKKRRASEKAAKEALDHTQSCAASDSGSRTDSGEVEKAASTTEMTTTLQHETLPKQEVDSQDSRLACADEHFHARSESSTTGATAARTKPKGKSGRADGRIASWKLDPARVSLPKSPPLPLSKRTSLSQASQNSWRGRRGGKGSAGRRLRGGRKKRTDIWIVRRDIGPRRGRIRVQGLNSLVNMHMFCRRIGVVAVFGIYFFE